jgi:hypothetical protein
MSTMSSANLSRLANLQQLMVAGHRPIRLRPASLLYWGLAFAWLAWSTDPLLRLPFLYGHLSLQACAAVAWLGGGIGLTAYLDWRATNNAAQHADETLPFVQVQVGKVWSLLMMAGVLYTLSTFFFGGAYQVYMVWLALAGLGLFLHGLFSHELVEWAGASIFLMALLVLVSGLPMAWHRPLVVCTAGLGLPLLALALHRTRTLAPSVGRTLLVVAGILAACVLPTAAVVVWSPLVNVPDDVPVYTHKQLSQLGERRDTWPQQFALHVAAGTPITMQLTMQGSLLKAAVGASTLVYTVEQDLDFLLIDGKFSHLVRRPGQAWRIEEGWLRILHLDFTPDLAEPSGLKVNSRVQVELGGMPR